MKTIVIGDNAVRTEVMEDAAKKLNLADNTIVPLTWGELDTMDFRHRAHHLELEGPEAEDPPAELYDEIKDADILMVHFCPVSQKLLEHADKLKLIMTCRGGTEHVDVNAATKKGIAVMHVIRNAEAASDFTIGLIYSETRNIARGHSALKNGEWRKQFPNSGFTKALYELKLGLIGLGNISRLVAKKANALGMEVIGYDPFVSEQDLLDQGIKVKVVDRDTVYREADVVSVHLKASPETRNIVNREVIGLMKKEAYLINTSRAAVLCKEDLIEALSTGQIAGAAIDVFWDEPVDPDDTILKLDNITMTPHMAGSVKSALENSPYLAVNVINDYLAGKRTGMCLNNIEWSE